MNQDLLKRLEKDQYFKEEVERNEERYRTLEQAAAYSDLSVIPEGILKHIETRNIYFYFGFQQPTSYKDLPKLPMFLAKNFHPRKDEPYTFVFFNEFCQDNYSLWNFRESFSGIKIDQIGCLDEFIVVKPFFYHKAMDWMTFGTIPKFLKSRTRFVYSCQDLCNHLMISKQAVIDLVPMRLYEKQFYDPTQDPKAMLSLRQNIDGQRRSQKQKEQMTEFMKNITSLIIKPGKQINNIEDYEICEIGIPTIVKMLVFYFQSNPESLQLQGLFRKSVSIDEETETIKKIMEKNYDYLLEVKNPHVIANLIKRFFSSLKNPIVPYEQFSKIMKDQGVSNQIEHLKNIITEFPQINRMTLMFILTFMKEHIIPNEEFNKMSEQNLSICFAPCWFRSEKASEADLLYASKAVVYSRHMIKNFDEVFGAQKEREDMYRKSFFDSKKNFENSIDIGLEETLKIMETNQGVKSSRFSSRYSRQVHEEVAILDQLEMFGESKITEKSQESGATEKEGSLLTFLEVKEEKQEGSNPRFSQKIEENQEMNKQEQNFMNLLNPGSTKQNPRFSRYSRDVGNPTSYEEVDDNILDILKEDSQIKQENSIQQRYSSEINECNFPMETEEINVEEFEDEKRNSDGKQQ